MLAASVGFSPWSAILFPVVSHHYVNLVLEDQVYDYNSVPVLNRKCLSTFSLSVTDVRRYRNICRYGDVRHYFSSSFSSVEPFLMASIVLRLSIHVRRIALRTILLAS